MIRRKGAAIRSAPIVLAVALLVTGAGAQEAPRDPAAAEALFSEAKALIADSKFREACPKLEQSMRLDPGTGTLLNLALCHEGLGKLATAWAEFREVEVRADRVGRGDRADLAREHQKQLHGRLSHLTLVVPLAVRTAGIEVKLDGIARDEVSWGQPLPIDPGPHRVEVNARGKKTWTAEVTIGAEHDDQSLTLVPLEDGAPVAAPVPVAAPAEIPAETPAPAPPETTSRRTAGFVVGGIGIAATGIGAAFGLLAISTQDDAKSLCRPRCTDEAERKSTDALLFANVANVAIAVGVLAMGAGTYLVVTSRQARVQVAPLAAPKTAGLALRGAW